MTKIQAATLSLAALSTPLFAQAASEEHSHTDATLEACIQAARAIRPGDIAKVEYLSVTEEMVPVYEIEIATPKGDWEFECDAHHGRIVEMEQEVDSASHPLFKERMKVTEAQARSTVLKLYPGTVDELEYEIEANGDPSYEIDVIDEYGVEWKVEVSAITGEIIEVQIETWEIGLEDTTD